MALTTTLIFYLLIGAGVALAVYLSERDGTPLESLFRVATALAFWPLYLPVLLRSSAQPNAGIGETAGEEELPDAMATAIAQVEAELDAAIQSLDGWAEDVLAGEQDRFAELKSAWRLQAGRIRELDRLLNQPEFLSPPAATGIASSAKPMGGGNEGSDRLRASEAARHENIRRLRALHDQLRDDLMGTLAWVRELVTMIHLARYTGAPASRAAELVSQVAASVEGLSEASVWREEMTSAPH